MRGDRCDCGFVVAVCELVEEPADEVDRCGEFVASEAEACSYVAGVIDDDLEWVGEVDEGVISAGVDVDAGGACDGTEDAEFCCCLGVEGGGAGEPVDDGLVGEREVRDFGEVLGDGREFGIVGKFERRARLRRRSRRVGGGGR